jgi:hypothetical protein
MRAAAIALMVALTALTVVLTGRLLPTHPPAPTRTAIYDACMVGAPNTYDALSTCVDKANGAR